MRKSLTDKEFETLKRYLEHEPDLDKLVIELCLCTGARQGEVVRMTKQSFDGEKVYIKALKGSKDRFVAISKERAVRIKKLFDHVETTVGALLSHGKENSQCRAIQRTFERVMMASLGSVPISLHGLRHTFAMRMLKALDKDVVAVQAVMGHSSMNSTAAYLQCLEMEEVQNKILIAMA